MTQRVLITAGANGIGLAMAEAFSDAGAQVWIADIDAAALAAAPDAWRRSELDASDEKQVAGLFDKIAADWGGLDVLCANAGVAGPTAGIEQVDLADWRRCIAVNLEGAFLTAKHVAPMMRRQGGGSIVFTSSTAGLYGYPNR
ncbi:MAG: SDR family oxidoreductase, partial [Neomegalonema sp.]